MFGGKTTRIKGGTFLEVTDGPLPSQTGQAGDRPFNDFWLALVLASGVDLGALGNDKPYTGRLPGLLA